MAKAFIVIEAPHTDERIIRQFAAAQVERILNDRTPVDDDLVFVSAAVGDYELVPKRPR